MTSRCCSAEECIGPVVLVEGLEDDDFVAGVRDGEQGRDHAFGCTAADRDFALRIVVEAVGALVFSGNRVAQGFRSPGDGVLVEIVA